MLASCSELARYACTDAVEQSDNKRSRSKLPFLPGAVTIFIPPARLPASAFRRFLSRLFSPFLPLDLALAASIRLSSSFFARQSPELALASRGSSQKGGFGDGAILPGQSNRAIVATNHPSALPLARPPYPEPAARASLCSQPIPSRSARVHCAGCRVNLFALYTRRRLYIYKSGVPPTFLYVIEVRVNPAARRHDDSIGRVRLIRLYPVSGLRSINRVKSLQRCEFTGRRRSRARARSTRLSLRRYTEGKKRLITATAQIIVISGAGYIFCFNKEGSNSAHTAFTSGI